MSEERLDRPVEAEDEAEVRALLRAAGRRPEVPAQELAALREAARGEWEIRYAAPAARRRAWGLGLAAAALAAALGLAWWVRQAPTPAPAALAYVERATGEATVQAQSGSPRPLGGAGAGTPLVAGAVLSTAGAGEPAAHVALRLLGGGSLRLDAGTRLRLVSAREVELLGGAVYFDSAPPPTAVAPPTSGPAREVAASAPLAVRTPLGIVQELGTQFEVRFATAGGSAPLLLRVREGSVTLATRERRIVGSAGEELRIGARGVVRRRLAPDDPSWGWVLAAAPPFAVEGATAGEVLAWVARETGWRLEIADARAESAAAAVLHGSIPPLSPVEVLGPVLAAAGLTHRVEDGRLIVRLRAPSAASPTPGSATPR